MAEPATTRKPRKLNERQRRFVDAYLQDPNATQAALKAGYSAKAAGAIGHDLLKVPEIAAAIEERGTTAIALADAGVQRIVGELAALGFSDLTTITGKDGGLRPVGEWPKEIRVCIASMEFDPESGRLVKVRLWSKTQALALLAQYRKMIGGDILPADQRQTFVGLAITVAPGAQVQINIDKGEK